MSVARTVGGTEDSTVVRMASLKGRLMTVTTYLPKLWHMLLPMVSLTLWHLEFPGPS